MIDIITHLVAAGFPFLVYAAFRKYRTQKPQSFDHLPHPKKAPSDWIIYRYGLGGHVATRFVYYDEENARGRARMEKQLLTPGRLFKDGEIVDSWSIARSTK